MQVVFFLVCCCVPLCSAIVSFGINPEELSKYQQAKFYCRDGTKVIPGNYINDDYCDCADGSDEPGTSACSVSLFYCENKGHIPANLPSSRVNDGICDCCDGSDEYLGFSKCENECTTLAKIRQAEHQAKEALRREGLKAKHSSMAAALGELNQKRAELEQLRGEKPAQEADMNAAREVKEKHEAVEQKEKDALKEEADKRKAVWEAQQAEEKAAKEAAEAEAKAQQGEEGQQQEQAQQGGEGDKQGEGTGEAAAQEEKPADVGAQEGGGDADVREEDEVKDDDYYGAYGDDEYNPSQDDYPHDEYGQDDHAHDDYDYGQDDLPDEPDFDTDHHIPPQHEEQHDDEYEYEETDDHYEHEDDSSTYVPHNNEDEVKPPEDFDAWKSHTIPDAEDARKVFNEKRDKHDDTERKIKDLEQLLGHEFGPNNEFFYLTTKCIELQTRDYRYKLCPYIDIQQIPLNGHSNVNLGKYTGWKKSDYGHYGSTELTTQLYEHGQSCWQGPERSMTVFYSCGVEDKVLSVDEPSMCVYTMKVETPAACLEQ